MYHHVLYLAESAKSGFHTIKLLIIDFHQVPVKASDRPKTAFVTPWGKYQYGYMPSGLKNAPAVFQRLMDIVLSECLFCAHAYIDEVVVFSSSCVDHKEHLLCVLQAVRAMLDCPFIPRSVSGQLLCALTWASLLAVDEGNLMTAR